MWSKGDALQIAPFKYKNHKSTEDLDKVIRAIQDELYYWKGKYISPATRQRILKKLKDWGDDLNGMILNSDEDKRKEECLAQLRVIYKALNAYVPDDYADNVDNIQAMMKYSVGCFLRGRNNMTLEDKLKMAKENKMLWHYNVEPLFKSKRKSEKTLNCKSFLGMQKELLDSFCTLNVSV